MSESHPQRRIVEIRLSVVDTSDDPTICTALVAITEIGGRFFPAEVADTSEGVLQRADESNERDVILEGEIIGSVNDRLLILAQPMPRSTT